METFILSVGGSLIAPDTIDVSFLEKFRSLLLNHSNKRFILVCGGGKTCRVYQDAARELGVSDIHELDWVCIRATMLNAELIRVMFAEEAYDQVILEKPTRIPETQKNIIISSGWKPGCSTDADAVDLAKLFGASIIINLSNIDYVYDKDPNKHKDAKKIETISWKEFHKLVGDERIPGGNYPFDPVASKKAEKMGLRVIITNGHDLKNLETIFIGKKYKGTTIE